MGGEGEEDDEEYDEESKSMQYSRGQQRH